MDRTEGPVTPEDGPTAPSPPAAAEDGSAPEATERSGDTEQSGAAAQPADAEEPGPTDAPGSAEERTTAEPDSATGTVPATGVPTGTAPRAVLRPVPEGFPTPPPRPARPNRAPAPAGSPDPAGTDPRRRRTLVAVAGLAAAIVLVLGVGGGVLAYRALTGPPAAAPAADGSTTGTDSRDGADGTVMIGGVEVRAVSVETMAEVGPRSDPMLPEGEFVVVTVDLDNATDEPLVLKDTVQLELADGSRAAPDEQAAIALRAESEPFTLIEAGAEVRVHTVFDVPEASDPVALHVDLSRYPGAGTGTLPLDG